MVARSATSEADPAAVWKLLSQPRSWSRWAPHIRGGMGLGEPEVQAGRSGIVLLGPGFPAAVIPALITAVDPGHSWSWRIAGVVNMDHIVDSIPGGGSRVTVEMRGPAGVELGLRLGYAPFVETLLRRLSRVAAPPAGKGSNR